MGKKQHQSEKLYISKTEWEQLYGGKKKKISSADSTVCSASFIPFYCCCLTFQEAKSPYCDSKGHVFDLVSIVPFIKKFHKNPVDGSPMTMKDLFKLNISRNEHGKVNCPVTFKILTENSHVVAIRPSGHVYSHEAVQKLNLDQKNMYDLLDSSPFCKSDIICLQDPNDRTKNNSAMFYHTQMKLDTSSLSGRGGNINLSSSAEFRDTMKSFDESYQKPALIDLSNTKAVKLAKTTQTESRFSSGKLAASLTSTAANVETTMTSGTVSEEEAFYRLVDSNAYIQLVTALGTINFELYCKDRPRTCHNFIALATQNYYDNTEFHLLEKDYYIQGGDRSGTGRQGKSIWGRPFKDEHRPFIPFDRKGILAMANTGKNTNESQFFVTFRPMPDLNHKYTLFGRAVGGLDVLDRLNTVKCDSNKRPQDKLLLISINILTNPYVEARQKLNELKKDPQGPDETAKSKSYEKVEEKSDAIAEKQDGDLPAKVIGKYLNVDKDQCEDGAGSHISAKNHATLPIKKMKFADW